MRQITKVEANYVNKADKDHCCDCTMFRMNGTCTLVIGDIAPGGHCDYFDPKRKLPTEGFKHAT